MRERLLTGPSSGPCSGRAPILDPKPCCSHSPAAEQYVPQEDRDAVHTTDKSTNHRTRRTAEANQYQVLFVGRECVDIQKLRYSSLSFLFYATHYFAPPNSISNLRNEYRLSLRLTIYNLWLVHINREQILIFLAFSAGQS